MSPLQLALQRSKIGFHSPSGTTEGNQTSKLQGIANKMAGIKIITDSRTTAKGNRTCTACRIAKSTGTPLPPQHPNCRCGIKKV